MPGSTFAITHHASVAEQEGQQTRLATGAPQKHHYTLNQQLGITVAQNEISEHIDSFR
jgi:hypothetical protein